MNLLIRSQLSYSIFLVSTVRRPVTGYDSDNQTFPEPKPDYTDDDFEVETVKKSPKKKGVVLF